MEETVFQELLESVRQAGQIRRGELRPSRTITLTPADAKAIHDRMERDQSVERFGDSE